jgi:methionyl-tRNA formyltransferase
MRVVFLGNAKWSVPSLEALAGSAHDLALVVTRAPRPGGRGNRLLSTPVADAARRLELPLKEVETVKSGAGMDAIVEAAPDVLAVVAYGEILPREVLALPKLAPVNVHFSLLPKLRGAAPVQHAFLSGLERTGVTTIRMDEGMDTGPILLQTEEQIRPEDDAGSLGDRLAASGGRLLVETLDGLGTRSIEERLQDHAAATYAPKIRAGDRRIDWSRPAEEIIRLVRAMSPDPGAATSFRGKGLKVLRAAAVGVRRLPPGSPALTPGTLDAWSGHPLAVMTGDGRVIGLEEVQPEGRRRMSWPEFVRGYRPEAGERLGEPPGEQPARG